jgi:hypothetical protein
MKENKSNRPTVNLTPEVHLELLTFWLDLKKKGWKGTQGDVVALLLEQAKCSTLPAPDVKIHESPALGLSIEDLDLIRSAMSGLEEFLGRVAGGRRAPESEVDRRPGEHQTRALDPIASGRGRTRLQKAK